MISTEQYQAETHQAVVDTALAFHLQAITTEGLLVNVPCGYQILQPGFRPFRAGKASPQELQDCLDGVVQEAHEKGIDLGIEGRQSLRKLSIQLGLGIDCSNFAYRALTLVHGRLDLPSYITSVFRDAAEIRVLHSKGGSWEAKDADGNPRELTDDEADLLSTDSSIDIAWIASLFGKDPAFITGSKHICSTAATEPTDSAHLMPCDLLAFRKAGTAAVSHVAVIETVEFSGSEVHADFWHAWHSRDFESGIRRDSVTFAEGSEPSWSHEGLADPGRYQGYSLVRPRMLADFYRSISRVQVIP